MRFLGLILIGCVLTLAPSCRVGQGTQEAPPEDNRLTAIGNPVETPIPGPSQALLTVVSLTSDVESVATSSSSAALTVPDPGGGCRSGQGACLTTSYAWGIRRLALLQCRDAALNPIDCPGEKGLEIVLAPGSSLDDISAVLSEEVENQFFYVAPEVAVAAALLGNSALKETQPITVEGVYSGFQIRADFILMELPADKTPVDANFALLCMNSNGCHALAGYPPPLVFPAGFVIQRGDFVFLRLSDFSWYFFDKEKDLLVSARPPQPLRQELPPFPVDSTGAIIYSASLGDIPSIVVDQARLEAGQTLRFKAVFSVLNALSYQDDDHNERIGLAEFESLSVGKPLIVNFEAVFE